MFHFDGYPYPSKRYVTYAPRGMAATSHHLAAAAGVDIQKKGGNAVDSAIAAASCLAVLEPQSNGIGSDNFAIVWTKGKLYGLNSSGYAPALADPEIMRAEGHAVVPERGWYPVTVPGAPAGWAALSGKFGRLPLSDVLEPAIGYAEEGYIVSAEQSLAWNTAAKTFRKLDDPLFDEWFRVFTVNGAVPKAGELWKLPDHAKTLRRIARTGARDYYKGCLADEMDAYSVKSGGLLRKADLAGYEVQWVEPVSVNYRGVDVWELPPNGQGAVALMALNILKGFELRSKEEARTWHLQVEALKLAFADGLRYITDPRHMTVDIRDLLSEAYAEERRGTVGESAVFPPAGSPPRGGTVYLCTADGEGNMVSMIQSDYRAFGSGVVVPGTGIVLQNRGHCFTLDPEHDNCLAPGKRPYHTIIPGFLTRKGEPVGPFGVMGGFMQPQGHLQVVSNMVDFGMNPQAALDAPRWQWFSGLHIELERETPPHIYEELLMRGHGARYAQPASAFGRGQIIQCLPGGGFVGGTEPRTGGAIIGW